MAQRTSNGSAVATLIAIVVAVGIVSAAFRGNSDRIPEDDDVTEQVTITVSFQPSIRLDDPVHIIVKVEGVDVENMLVARSSWIKQVTIPRGAQVSVNAQQTIDGQLSCLMAANGATVSTNSRDSMGSVRCWHNRR